MPCRGIDLERRGSTGVHGYLSLLRITILKIMKKPPQTCIRFFTPIFTIYKSFTPLFSSLDVQE